MSLNQPERADPEAGGWPPRVQEDLPFDSVEAQSLISRRGRSDAKTNGLSTGQVISVSRAKVAPVGVDLVDQAAKALGSPSVSRNLRALNTVVWAVVLLAVVIARCLCATPNPNPDPIPNNHQASLLTLLVLTVRGSPFAPAPHTNPFPPAHCLRAC